MFAKQTSEFDIKDIKFSPISDYKLVSCGKENIRFWEIKKTKNIRGSSVILGPHCRETVFTSLDFEWGARYEEEFHRFKDPYLLQHLYVASKHGMVFKINYHTEAMESNYRTNDTAIHSIACNENYCVTGTEDNFLRVWHLDFSDIFMEAPHDGAVC